MREYDLNVFYREDWNPEDGTTWADTLTIDVYIREDDEYGCRNYETSYLLECSMEETLAIAKLYPEEEYGSDWWTFAIHLIEEGPESIKQYLLALPQLEDPSIDVGVSLEPAWWVTKNDDMLF